MYDELNKWHTALDNLALNKIGMLSPVLVATKIINAYEGKYGKSLLPAITSVEDYKKLILEWNSKTKYFEIEIDNTYSWNYHQRDKTESFGEENLNLDGEISIELLEKLNEALS